jgi:hypothetical protein
LPRVQNPSCLLLDRSYQVSTISSTVCSGMKYAQLLAHKAQGGEAP